MPDPRISQLAQILVNYSLDLQPGDEFCLVTSPLAEELNLAVYKSALLAGANISVLCSLPGLEEIFYKYASDAQLEYIAPFRRLAVEQFDARLIIMAPYNTRDLSAIAPERISHARKAGAELSETFWRRFADGTFKWCDTLYPTPALAQEADMSLPDYREFVFSAAKLDQPDPLAAWQQEQLRQTELVAWLAGKQQARFIGPHIDLSLSIAGRNFGAYNGQYNFPDGEIATSPVESSANGWVRFSYPGVFSGKEIEAIELWFEDGKVIREQAAKGQALLTALLDTDAGSRYLGEWGIGTNYGIRRFTKNMLFDEKMGGTIHLAVGAGLHQAGGLNASSLHWDMLCDMSQSEILVDGELFYKDGKFMV
jgi:aminopeptidase